MRTLLRLVLLVVLASAGAGATAAQPRGGPTAPPAVVSPQATPGPCTDGTLPSGAKWRFCVPSAGWNGDLVLWAHGYTAPGLPLDFQNLTLPDGTPIPDLVQSQGFAFGTTSYRRNGLAILEGVQDMRELAQAFQDDLGKPRPARIYLLGASEGGAVVSLLLERYPSEFSGGLATCGPIGSFVRQLNYTAHFRVLFDYFFPGVIPGSPVDIPAEVIANWSSTYVPAINAALAGNPNATRQLLSAAKGAFNPQSQTSAAETIQGVLWYNIVATNDAKVQLGGNPFDNRSYHYWGSDDDVKLNAGVQRFSADAAALTKAQDYETSGAVSQPLVTMHTTADPIVPFWHEVLYANRSKPAAGGSFTPLTIARYGHCSFSAAETLQAFALLNFQARRLPGAPPVDLAAAGAAFTAARRSALAELAPRILTPYVVR